MRTRSQPSAAWLAASVLLLAVAIGMTLQGSPGSIASEDPRVYVDAAESLLRGDYVSDAEPTGVPRYPPGFPLLLAPFVGIWGDDGARAASMLIGAALVVLVWLCSRRFGGHRGAALAMVLWVMSPLVVDYSTDVMSDAAGAGFVLLAILAADRSRWALAGAALAWSCWIRIIHAVFLLGVGLRRRSWVAAVVVLVPLAVFQVAVYGRLAGYDGESAQFSLANITGQVPLLYYDRPSPWPNWQFFPGLLWGLRGGLVPLLPLAAGYELIARRAEPTARLAAWIIVANVLVYLPYYYQAPRFVFPAACLVIVFASAGAVRLVDSVVRPATAVSGETPPDR